MSDVMERTLASIPRLLSSTLRGGGRGGQTITKSQSVQSFQNFLKYVDSARGRSEQAAVVQRELSYIEQQFNHPDASVSKWSESFPTIIFCAMLGYDVSFCHIYTLKLAAHGKGAQKKVGYLAATLLLDPACEITILMTGTLYKDLMSSNMLDNHMALSAAAELLSAEHIPMMLAPVVKLLRHRQAMVRARAVYCLQAFFRRAPSLMQSHVAEVKGMLGDRDPGVLMAVVTTIESLVGSVVGEQFCDLTMSFVSILQQIRAYKFPALFSYHGLPLPWLQVKLLKILAHVVPLGGSGDNDDITTAVITLLSHVVRDTVSKETMSLAILEESLTTITALAAATLRGEGDGESSRQVTMKGSHDPGQSGEEASSEELYHGEGTSAQPQGAGKGGEERAGGGERDRRMLLLQWTPLLEEASRCVASFLGADIPNLRYIGVKLLTRLVSVSADLAFHHRDKVVHCLNDPDPIIRRQTLALLQHMAVADNFRTVCATMMKHAQKGNARDKADVIDMVISISHRLNSDPEWYLHTIFPLLSWRLDSARLRFIMNSMLSFFVKACQDSEWPRFPELLFTTVVESVVMSEGRADPSVKFCLCVLRLIPLTRDKTFSMETFLVVCSKLVACDSPAMDLKRDVVLCVEALLLRGVLDQEGVLLWTRNQMDSVGASTSYHYRSSLLELFRLASASVDTDATPLFKMKSLFAQKTPKKMDYSLSFLDLSIKSLHEKSRPFLKTLQPAGGQEARDSIPLLQGSAGSENSEEGTSSMLSSGGSPLYGDIAPCSEYGKGSEAVSPSSALKTLHGVKQRWTKHGFNNSADEEKSQNKSPSTDNSSEDDQASAEDAEKENTEEEDLAQALFQGLSPPSSVTSAVSPAAKIIVASQKSSSSSGFDSSSSQNSAGTSGQNTPPVGHQGGDVPSHQAAGESQRDNTTLPAELELESDSDSEGIVSPPSSNSWRALHTACADHQTKSNTEQDQQLSPSATADVTSSDVESASHLSISDDSLENAGASSIPNSPVKTTLQDLDSFSIEREGQEKDGNEESVLSQFLVTQMMDSKTIQTERSAEGDIVNSVEETPESEDTTTGEVSSEGSNLYSTFEILTGSSPDEDLGNVVAEVVVGEKQ